MSLAVKAIWFAAALSASSSMYAESECTLMSGEIADRFAGYAKEHVHKELGLNEGDMMLYGPVDCGETIAVTVFQKSQVRNWTLDYDKRSEKLLHISRSE